MPLAVDDKAIPPSKDKIPILLKTVWSPITLPAGRGYTLRVKWAIGTLSGTKELKIPNLKAGVYRIVAFQMGSPYAAELGWGDFKEPTGRSNAVLLALIDEDKMILALAM